MCIFYFKKKRMTKNGNLCRHFVAIRRNYWRVFFWINKSRSINCPFLVAGKGKVLSFKKFRHVLLFFFICMWAFLSQWITSWKKLPNMYIWVSMEPSLGWLYLQYLSVIPRCRNCIHRTVDLLQCMLILNT